MKTCKCGKELASNARTCPGCGYRFTSPFVKVLAFVLIALVVLIFVVAMIVGGSGGGSNNNSAVNTPSPSPVAPVKAISSAERGYINASREYLGSANAEGTQMATVMAGASNGTSSLADIHSAIRKNLADEKQRYSTYLRTRGTVPPTFKIVDKHIGEVHTKSVAALSLLLSYWTTCDLNAIPRGSDQYQAAILQMNSTIEEATSILKGMK